MTPQAFLAALRHRLRAVLLLSGLSRLVVWSLLMIAGVALLDYINALPQALRLLALLVMLAVIVVHLRRRLVRPLTHDMGDVAMAGLAERRLPGLDGRLFAVVDDLSLNEEERQRLAGHCHADNVRRLIRTRDLRRWLAAAVAVLLLLGGTVIYLPHTVRIAAGRVLTPWSDAWHYPRSREISAELEQGVVPVDEPVVVAVRRERGDPAVLRVRWRDQDGSVDGITATSMVGPWRERLSLDSGTYAIEVTYGDALPVTLEAVVVPRPSLRDLTVTVEPPAYAREEPRTLVGPSSITALAGCQVACTFAFARRAGAASQDLEARIGTVPLELTSLPDDRHRGRFVVAKPGELVLTATDRHRDAAGREYIIEAKPVHRIPIELRADMPPRVQLTGPDRNEAVTVQAVVALTVSARDDIGLAALTLQAQTVRSIAEEDDGPEAADSEPDWRLVTEFAGFTGNRLRETGRAHELRVSEWAGEGDELVLIAEARDANDIDGPGVGRSEPVPLRVVSVEALRRELDRILGQSRDRIILARDQIAGGLATPEDAVPAARNARTVARRGVEHLREAIRRWRANGLDPQPLTVVGEALDLVERQALEALAAAATAIGETAADLRRADGALGRAERMLSSLLRSGDLTDRLSRLLQLQRRLSADSTRFVFDNLTGELDQQALNRQIDLSERQRQQAEQLAEWQEDLLESADPATAPARDLVRAQQPAALLDRAAGDLAGARNRRRALEDQSRAVTAMEELLELLRGTGDDSELAALAGELAARQEALQAELEDGADPAAQRPEQDRIREDTGQLRQRVAREQDDEEIDEALQGAEQAQEEAGEAMDEGRRRTAAREAAAAASLLRQVQRALDPRDEGEDESAAGEDDSDSDKADVLALLRRLRGLQRRVVTDASVLHQAIVGERAAAEAGADAALNFSQKRRLLPIADRQEEVQLLLQEEGIEALDAMPLVVYALGRLRTAVDRAVTHLQEPALGERGVRLTKTVLYELERLLAIVDSLPEPQPAEEEDGGQGEGQPQADQAPFPPRAMLGLLLAEQDRLRLLSAARYPIDLAAAQTEMRDLVEGVLGMARPGSRPHVLLQRAIRAMSGAAWALGEGDDQVLALTEQDAAAAAIVRIIAEAKAAASAQSQRQQQTQRSEQSQPAPAQQAQPGDSAEEGQDPQELAGGGSETSEREAAIRAEVNEEMRAWLMNLPPKARERLLEAHEQGVPAEGILLYRRFLELLEEGE